MVKSRLLPLAGMLSMAVLVAGCGSSGGDPPTETPTRPANPFVDRDGAIRPVRMTSGRALTYVQPETASQILCQTLDRDRWAQLLGGRVGRHPAGAPTAACMIASDEVGVNLSLRRSDEAFKADSTIAGRPASHREVYSGDIVTTVAITDDALRPAPRQYRLARQLLDVEVTYGSSGDAKAQRDRAADVLTEIVPSLAREADPLPDIDDEGLVRYVSTPLTPGTQFVDLPLPAQALHLCTIMQESPTVRVAPARVEVRERGECRVVLPGGETIVVDATYAHGTPTYSDRVAGRSARIELDAETVRVRLRDDAQVDLRVAANDPVALAEKLVPLLLSP